MFDADSDNSLLGPDKLYYKRLLKQNYIRDLPPRKSVVDCLQMEHSYSRDWRPMEGAQVMTTRTILVHRPPPCPSCHVAASDDIRVDMNDQNPIPIPPYNEEAAKTAMEECEKIAANVKNGSPDDEDWEKRVTKFGWSRQQNKLFNQIVEILDLDQLARLASKEKQHETVLRRATVDKSVSRMRQSLASITWQPQLTQWLHGLLMDVLSPTYLASYFDILQKLKAKVPTLVEQMIFGRPINQNEILSQIFKKPWEPAVIHKSRKLPGQAVIIVAPSSPNPYQRWNPLLTTMTSVVCVSTKLSSAIMKKQSFSFISDQMVAACRQKIQELRTENPSRKIILLGFNSGASLALQVGLTEQLSSIICLGFAFHTLNGVRGEPDDRILEITTPVLFVQGQIAARASQEEIESLREKMQAQTSLVVVGSADDMLRVNKNKRKIEGVTQAMVDNMIADEICEFATTCILNPPSPRDLATENIGKIANGGTQQPSPASILPQAPSAAVSSTHTAKKRKQSQSADADTLSPTKQARLKDMRDGKSTHVPRKVGRPRLRPPSPKRPKPSSLLQQPTTEALNKAIQSILPPTTAVNTPAPKTPQKLTDSTISPQVPPSVESTSNIIETIVTPKQQRFPQPSPKPKPKATIIPMAKPMTTTISTRPVQKVKISPNQLMQLKQSQTTSQPKTFSFKPSTNVTLTSGLPSPIGSPRMFTVRTPPTTARTADVTVRPTNKIFTVKTIASTPTQPQLNNIQVKTVPSTSSPLIISPTKFTIFKPPTTGVVAGTSTVTSSPLTIKLANTPATITKVTPDLSSTNIFDIPIVFADNDGNIQDSTQQQQITTATTIDPNVKQLVQNRSIVINNIVQPRPNIQNKVMLINRSQVKPVPNILSKSMPPLKYTKVVVTAPSGGINTLPKVDPTSIKQPLKLNITPLSKVDLINSGLIKTTIAQIPPVAISTSTTTGTPTTISKYHPIVINVDSDKTTIKNMITVNESQVKPNTILIKPGGMRQIPMLKPGILNRSLTVKKLNLIPQQKTLATTAAGISGISATVTGIASASGVSPIIPITGSIVPASRSPTTITITTKPSSPTVVMPKVSSNNPQ